MGNKKIKKEDYLKALDIVTEYHKQIINESEIIKLNSNNNITIKYFLKNSDTDNKRLLYILDEYRSFYGDVLLDDVLKFNFLRLRNAGEKAWCDFLSAKEIFFSDLKSIN